MALGERPMAAVTMPNEQKGRPLRRSAEEHRPTGCFISIQPSSVLSRPAEQAQHGELLPPRLSEPEKIPVRILNPDDAGRHRRQAGRAPGLRRSETSPPDRPSPGWPDDRQTLPRPAGPGRTDGPLRPISALPQASGTAPGKIPPPRFSAARTSPRRSRATGPNRRK